MQFLLDNEDTQQAFDLLLETATHAEDAGDLKKAIASFQDAVQLVSPTEDLSLHTGLLNNLALLQKRVGNVSEAREILQRAIRLLEASTGDVTTLVTLWNNLGFIERDMGNVDEARKDHLKALGVAQAGNNLLEMVRTFMELAIVDKDQQQLSAARINIEHALTLLKNCKSPHLRGHVYTVRALISLMENRLAEGRQDYKKALAAYRRAGDRENEALILHNIGQMYDTHAISKKDYSLALQYYTKSLKINNAIGSELGSADDLGSMAGLFQILGQRELAQKMHEKSLQAYQAMSFRQGQVDALTDLGILARDEQQFDRAKQYLSDALQIALEMGDLHSIVDVYLDRGDVSLMAHQFQEAITDYAHAVEITESIRALLQETDALGYFDEARLTAYKHLIRLSARSDTPSAFSYMERMKSREFLRRLSRGELPQSPRVPDELVEQETQLLLQLRQLAATLAGSLMDDGPSLLSRYQLTEKHLHAVWAEMEHYDQEYVALRYGTPTSWKNVKSLLFVN